MTCEEMKPMPDTDFCPNCSETIARIKSKNNRIGELRTQLDGLLALFNECDKERLEETNTAHDEAAYWKREEEDMYGWNFHEGKSSGVTHASIIFGRVRRRIEEIIKQAGMPA